VFEHGILGPATSDPYVNTPRRALIFRPFAWKRNGFLLSRDALFFRRGAIWRQLAIFPLARLQSVGLDQGPFDRALGVAAVHAHTITGRVSGRLSAIDRDAAVSLFADAEAAAVTAGVADHSHRWAGDEELVPVGVADAPLPPPSPVEPSAAPWPAPPAAGPATPVLRDEEER
jgi:putative membrane protein